MIRADVIERHENLLVSHLQLCCRFDFVYLTLAAIVINNCSCVESPDIYDHECVYFVKGQDLLINIELSLLLQ